MEPEPRPPAAASAPDVALPPRVLYLAYWGALEPLGQSLVVPALERMAGRGADLSFVSFEKPSDWRLDGLVEATAHRLRARGIHWIALRYHKRPRIPATLFDIVNGWRVGVSHGRRTGIRVVHGRTFVGGLIGRTVAATLGVPFIYHNEGFYPDEMVDGGFWSEGSSLHRVTKALERRLYEGADGLVVLSSRAARIVGDLPTVRRRGTPMVVVPSCVDLQRFVPRTIPPSGGPMRLVYSGGVGGRYQIDRIARFVAVLAQEVPARLVLFTREPHVSLARIISAGGLREDQWESQFVPHAEMPARLAAAHAGLNFLARGAGESGASPTKIGEYWACGLPVVTTPGIGDIDELITHFRSGVIVPEHTDAAYRRAAGDLRELVADPGLRDRCRAAAEAHYALEPACDRQVGLYRVLTAQPP